MVATDDQNLWIFGFGSLIYKAGFEYAERLEGYIKGYKAVWYQGSTDHRGIPGAPGRVVTIIPAAQDDKCWGAAYRLPGSLEEQKRTLEYLEWREKQYDQRAKVSFFTAEDHSRPRVSNATTFIATSNIQSNPNYLGYAEPEAIAQQISTAHGPSGDNCDYLYAMAEAYAKMGVQDLELEALAARVHQLRAQAGHHDDRKAAHSRYLMVRDEYDRCLAEGDNPPAANGLTQDSAASNGNHR